MNETTRVFGGRTIAPMKAMAARDQLVQSGQGSIIELKWDGMRIVSFVDAGGVRLQSTNLLEVTASYPELDALGPALADFGPVILDGEVVAFDSAGRPSFPLLQQRMHIKDRNEASRRAQGVPISYVIFDLLHLDGSDIVHVAWEDRRRLLEQVIDGAGASWRLSTVHDGGELPALVEVVIGQKLEGLVVKKRSSRYEPGKRSRSWTKIKPRMRQEFVVGGWIAGEGNRSATVGSLLVGYYDDEKRLRFAGRVGSGLSHRDLNDWAERADSARCDQSPFFDTVPPKPGRQIGWCEPVFVVEIAFAEWGQAPEPYLRHPSYLGLRTDKDPLTVVREDEEGGLYLGSSGSGA